jgi:hypothetical protein
MTFLCVSLNIHRTKDVSYARRKSERSLYLHCLHLFMQRTALKQHEVQFERRVKWMLKWTDPDLQLIPSTTISIYSDTNLFISYLILFSVAKTTYRQIIK